MCVWGASDGSQDPVHYQWWSTISVNILLNLLSCPTYMPSFPVFL